MRIPYKAALVFVSSLLSLSFLICGPQTNSRAQESGAQATVRGMQLYEQGNTSEAIKLLKAVVARRPDDADAWYFLALALNREGTFGYARPAFEKYVTLRINPSFASALITRSFAQYNLKQYSEAAASLEQFLALNPDDLDAGTWRGQLAELSNLTQQPANSPAQVFSTKEVTQKARVSSKPEPQYSEAARRAGVTGTVVIRAVFAADGEVKHILVTRALGYGLTTQSVKAARRIKFEPAMKDGQPVSNYMMLEYNFSLY